MNKTTDEIREELLSHKDEYDRIVENLNYFGTKIEKTTLEEFALGYKNLPDATVEAIHQELRSLPISDGYGVPRREEDIQEDERQKENKSFLVRILEETCNNHGIRMEKIEEIVQDNARAICLVDEALQNGLLENAGGGIVLFGGESPSTPHYNITPQGAQWLLKNRS